MQYLAAEYELIWHGMDQARPCFEQFAKLFAASPDVDAQLLADGGHNYEFTRNANHLHDLRMQFIARIVRSRYPLGCLHADKPSLNNRAHVPLLLRPFRS